MGTLIVSLGARIIELNVAENKIWAACKFYVFMVCKHAGGA